jgi:preprotein translocase subunit SecA
MQHLENMDHLREGIHWMSVGQQDPLVEYRRRGQQMFEEMQMALRHDVLRALYHAEPVEQVDEELTETELTKAARGSVAGANRVLSEDTDYHAEDFAPKKKEQESVKKVETKLKKARKQERKRKSAARKRK